MFTGHTEYEELKREWRTTRSRTRAPLRTTHDERVWSDTEHKVMLLKRSIERAAMRRIVKQLQQLKE